MFPRQLLHALAVLVPLVSMLLVSGCSDYEWKTSNITGKFPDLEFELTSEHDETITEEDFANTINMLFFGFTSCPDVCPMTLSRLNMVMDNLEPQERRQIRVLFVSVDPQRDTPPKLREYTNAFGPHLVGATADVETLETLTSRYHTAFSYGEKDSEGNYNVNHNGSVFVFDRQGKARLKVTASSVGGIPSDSVEAIASDLRALID